jgi:molybdopterin-guanine dinucleotide biosynthesis protein MobB
MSDRPRVIQVVGDSGSGKTLVVERCVRRLSARGLSVAVVTHSHHSPDLEGKDTARYTAAGADAVLFASRASFLAFRGSPEPLVRLLPVDVVLVEGYSRRTFGGTRVRIRQPKEASRVVGRILKLAPRRPGVATVVLDGRQRSADRFWRLVLNVMADRRVREVRRP